MIHHKRSLTREKMPSKAFLKPFRKINSSRDTHDKIQQRSPPESQAVALPFIYTPKAPYKLCRKT